MKIIAFLILFTPAVFGQVSNPSIIPVSAAPSGSCTANLPDRQKTPDGTLYSCQNGTWAQIGGSSGVTTIGNSDGTLTISPTSGTVTASLALGHANTWTAPQNNSTAGALSTPATLLSGLPIATGGTGTTTLPLFLFQPTGATAVTGWSTTGTFLGVNTTNGFTGNFIDLWVNGFHRFNFSAAGIASAVGYATFGNCSSAASPAVCSNNPAGSVAVAAGTNPTLQVNTTAVTANSQILLTEDESLGTKLGVTCQTATLPTSTIVTARTAGTSFTIQANGTFTTSPICYSYTIIN